VVSYRAPHITYAPDSLPRDRLVKLLGELSLEPRELLAEGFDAAWAARLSAYWAARDQYLDVGRHVRLMADVRRMLAQAQAPLLSVLRLSPDFRPAYEPLLRMAAALGRQDPAAARALLAELMRLQPAWPEATEVLRGLAARAP
jgi:spermidine synthase